MAYVAFLMPLIGTDGDPESGGLVNTFIRNTSTRIPVYSDVAGTTPATNPVVANTLGQVVFYFSDAVQYSWSATTADGATVLWQADVVGGIVSYTYLNDGLIQQFEESATGNGTTTAYTIEDVVLTSPYQLVVSIDGLVQPTTSYSVGNNGTDTTVTFSTAPLNGSAIYMRSFAAQGLTGPAGTPADMDAYTAWSAPDGELTVWGRTAGSLNRKHALGSGWTSLIGSAAASGVVMLTGNQTGIAGEKGWTGQQTYDGAVIIKANAILGNTAADNSILLSTAADAAGRLIAFAKSDGTDLTLPVTIYGSLTVARTGTGIGRGIYVPRNYNADASAPSEAWTAVDIQVNNDVLQTSSLYHYAGGPFAVRQNIGFTRPAGGSFHTISADLQINDLAVGTATGFIETVVFYAASTHYSGESNGGANGWCIADFSAFGPTTLERRHIGMTLLVNKYASGNTYSSSYDGSGGFWIVAHPGNGPKPDGFTGLTGYTQNAAFKVIGWAGPVSTATDGTSGTATAAFEYALDIGGGGATWLAHNARSKFTNGVRIMDTTDYGLIVDNVYSGSAIYVTDDGGAVGFGVAPDTNIRLLVAASASGMAQRLRWSDTGTGFGPYQNFYRSSLTATAQIGGSNFTALNSASNETEYARASVFIVDATNGSEDGLYRIGTMAAGTFATRMDISNGVTIYNNLVVQGTTIVFSGASTIIEFGATGSSNTPAIDWHSSSSSTDYDVRMIASGGTASAGQGTLTFTAANIVFNAVPVVPTYTVAGVPSASTYARGIIYVSNETGGATIAFSDGTNWRRVADRAIVS